MQKFGYLLKECREMALPNKLTQNTVATALQTHDSVISRIEAGRIMPRFSRLKLLRLANLFREHKVPEDKIQELVSVAELSFLDYTSLAVDQLHESPNILQPRYSNDFRYLLQKAIALYAKTQNRDFSDVLAEMDYQLGYRRNSQTIQRWLNENIIPNSAEVEYFAKKITGGTNLNFEWVKQLFDAAGYKIPSNIIAQFTKPDDLSESNVIVSNNVMIGNNQITINLYPSEQSIDIFISYARNDVDIVQSIYEILLNKNHNPWMDIHSLKGGENWLRAIYKAIDKSEIFLAILSNNSVSRRGVIQKELKKALDRWEGMLPDDIYIIPVRIDDCPIPDLLKHIQVLDWDGGKGENKLLEAIRVGLARRKADG